jgi:hypothetical protein
MKKKNKSGMTFARWLCLFLVAFMLLGGVLATAIAMLMG